MARLSILCKAALAATLALLVTHEASAQSFKKLDGVNYNIRAGADWEPDATKCKSAGVIKQELAKLKGITDTIRLYSLGDCDQATKVLKAAVEAKLKVAIGLWVGSDPAAFEAEKAKFVELLTKPELMNSNNVVGIHVGSEAVYRGDVNTTVAIANFRQIKKLCTAKGLAIPVTIADVGDVYLAHPELIDAVDVVSANAFPFWEKIDADKAAAYLYSRLGKLIELAGKQNKQVFVSETGWATAGVHKDASAATPANAARYLRDFYALAQQHQLKYYYFAGFDESWKLTSLSSNSTVEAYFGLFDKKGALKSEYAAVLTLKEEAAAAPGTIHADSLDTDSTTSGMDVSGGAGNINDNNANNNNGNNNVNNNGNNNVNNNGNNNGNNNSNAHETTDGVSTGPTSAYSGVAESAAAPAMQNTSKHLDCAM